MKSLEMYAPYLNVLILDDSKPDLQLNTRLLQETFTNHNGIIEVINFNNPLGIGKGRNILVNKAKGLGYKYLLVSDDDYEITSSKIVENLAKVILREKADIVSVRRDDVWYREKKRVITKPDRSAGVMTIMNGELKIFPNVSKIGPDLTIESKKHGCINTDLAQQFFLAKIKTLVNNPWDDNLIDNDHYDFLVQNKNSRIIACLKLPVFHDKTFCPTATTSFINGKKFEFSSSKDLYQKIRDDNSLKSLKYLMNKHDLTSIYGESGLVTERKNGEIMNNDKSSEVYPMYKIAKNNINSTWISLLQFVNSKYSVSDQKYYSKDERQVCNRHRCNQYLSFKFRSTHSKKCPVY